MGVMFSKKSGKSEKPKKRNTLRFSRKSTKYDLPRAVAAAKTIQNTYRRFKARLELRKQASYMILETYAQSSEKEIVKMHNLYEALKVAFPINRKMPFQASVHFSGSFNLDNLVVEGSIQKYKVHAINFPLTRSGLDYIINHLVNEEHNTLPPIWISKILRAATRKLRNMPNINLMELKPRRQVIICGSLYGNLDNLFTIFRLKSMPSLSNTYIFNGNIVDFGNQSIEVLTLIMAFFITYPEAVYINRGKHEDTIMNARFGFIDELNSKYPYDKEALVSIIEDLYRWLPLATIISHKIFVVHGGIPRKTDLQATEDLPRELFTSVVCPTSTHLNSEDRDTLFDLLWGEPVRKKKDYDGSIPKIGLLSFTGRNTLNFLQEHNFKLIIRSHRCSRKGFEWNHNGNVLSLSSVSDFYGIGSNQGAFAILRFPQKVICRAFISDKMVKRHLKMQQITKSLEEAALEQLLTHLYLKRYDLEQAFLEVDRQNCGFVTLCQWADCFRNVTQLQFPWYLWVSKFLTDFKSDLFGAITTSVDTLITPVVDYRNSMSLLEQKLNNMENLKKLLTMDSLCKNTIFLGIMFSVLDIEKRGYVSLNGFKEACHILEKFFPDKYRANDMIGVFKLMDLDHDGIINIYQFIEIFCLFDELKYSKIRASNRMSKRT